MFFEGGGNRQQAGYHARLLKTYGSPYAVSGLSPLRKKDGSIRTVISKGLQVYLLDA